MLVSLAADRVQAFPSAVRETVAHGSALLETAARLVRQPHLAGELKRWRDLLSGKTLGRRAAEAARQVLVQLRETSPAEFRKQGLHALDLRPRGGALTSLTSEQIWQRATSGKVSVVESAPKRSKRSKGLLAMSADQIWAACGGH